MALSLTCVCGARFELDDTLAGQTINCPDCQQALKAPALQHTARVTSLLALASAVMALVFAFTVVGSAAAVVLGVMALSRIARHRERLAGAGLALFGIIAGSIFTGLTVFALGSGELFGLGGQLREKMLADHVDVSEPLEHIERGHGFAISRPSKKWGKVVNDLDDPIVHTLQQQHAELLLVQMQRNVFVDVRAPAVNGRNLATVERDVLTELGAEDNDFRNPRRNPFAGDDGGGLLQPTRCKILDSRNIQVDGGEGRELNLETTVGGQRWLFLVRLYRTSQNKVYVVRAYGQGKKRFADARPELDQVLDSFRMLR